MVSLSALLELAKVAFFSCLLLMLFACKSTPELPDRVIYSCDFDIVDYFPDSPRLEINKLSELFSWINRRVKGGLNLNPGYTLTKKLEYEHWNTPSHIENRYRRTIWLLPSEVTKNNNPMNIVIDRQGDKYILTRIDDEYRDVLGFRLLRKSIKRTDFGIKIYARYCAYESAIENATES